MEKIIVIAPHADDEVLGCGGTISKHVAHGNEVNVIIVTNAHVGDPALCSADDIKKVRNEAIRAHDILGVNTTLFMDFPAPRLNAFPEYKISQELDRVFKEIRPQIIYIPHHGDMHQDHKAVHRAALVAARPRVGQSIRRIYCYETLSETEWAPMQESPFVPNVFNDITDFIEMKLEAMNCFQSQLKKFPDPRSLEAIEALATFRGSTSGIKRAEAFILERDILL